MIKNGFELVCWLKDNMLYSRMVSRVIFTIITNWVYFFTKEVFRDIFQNGNGTNAAKNFVGVATIGIGGGVSGT